MAAKVRANAARTQASATVYRFMTSWFRLARFRGAAAPDVEALVAHSERLKNVGPGILDAAADAAADPSLLESAERVLRVAGCQGTVFNRTLLSVAVVAYRPETVLGERRRGPGHRLGAGAADPPLEERSLALRKAEASLVSSARAVLDALERCRESVRAAGRVRRTAEAFEDAMARWRGLDEADLLARTRPSLVAAMVCEARARAALEARTQDHDGRPLPASETAGDFQLAVGAARHVASISRTLRLAHGAAVADEEVRRGRVEAARVVAQCPAPHTFKAPRKPVTKARPAKDRRRAAVQLAASFSTAILHRCHDMAALSLLPSDGDVPATLTPAQWAALELVDTVEDQVAGMPVPTAADDALLAIWDALAELSPRDTALVGREAVAAMAAGPAVDALGQWVRALESTDRHAATDAWAAAARPKNIQDDVAFLRAKVAEIRIDALNCALQCVVGRLRAYAALPADGTGRPVLVAETGVRPGGNNKKQRRTPTKAVGTWEECRVDKSTPTKAHPAQECQVS